MVIGEQPSGEIRIGDAAEEFVADGVLNLKLTTPRELEIRKMRGTRLQTKNATYTIDNGFRVLTTTLRTPGIAEKWKPIADSGELNLHGQQGLRRDTRRGLPERSILRG